MDQQRYLDIVSGRAGDLCAALARPALRAASRLYGAGVRLRLAAVGVGLLRRRRAAIPVICVGNLTVGGTGKTPMCALVYSALRELGRRPALVSRGYRARGKRGESASPGTPPNDEALLLAETLPDLIHVQNPDRRAGVAEAARRGADAAILDDGFSHLRLARDLDILLIDASRPFGYDALLPRGLLREPLSSVRRAGLVVITRCEMVEADALIDITRRLVNLGVKEKRILLARHAPRGLLMIGDDSPPLAPESLSGKKVAAMCGIGNPDAFIATLRRLGADVVKDVTLDDHFAYGEKWLAEHWPKPRAECLANGAEAVIVTHKDGVKLREPEALRLVRDGADAARLPILELRIEMELLTGTDVFREALAAALDSGSA